MNEYDKTPVATETSEGTENDAVMDITKVGRSNDAEQVIPDLKNSKAFVHEKSSLSDAMHNTLNSQSEIAIIAFWKKDKIGAFHCYHYFYIPKPSKRLLRYSLRKLMNGDSSTASIYQVLFTSSDNELFMFFEETAEENTEIHVAILNLDNLRFGQHEPIENRHYSKRSNLKNIYKISDTEITQKALRNFLCTKKQKTTSANPDLIKNFNPGDLIDEEDAELEEILEEAHSQVSITTPLELGSRPRNPSVKNLYTLVFSHAPEKKESNNNLYFYNLNERGGKMAKIIIGGELFLKYDPAMNQLVYLINKQKSDQRIQRRLTMSDKGQQLFSKGSMLSQQSLASLPSLGKEDSLNKMDSLDSELLDDIGKIESK